MNFKELAGNLRIVGLQQNDQYSLLTEELKNSQSADKEIFVTFLCCPDYSYKVDNSGWAISNHKELNIGIGLTGLIFIQAFIEIVEMSVKYKARVKITFAYGDNEVDDPDRLTALNLSPDEFISKVQCSISSARIFYSDLLQEWYKEQKIEDNNTIRVDALGMKNRFYTDQTTKLAWQKVNSISKDEINDLVEKRKSVIESTYKKSYTDNLEFFYAKTLEQVFDRVVIGSALAQEREKGKKTIIVSQSIPSMMGYFNYKNNVHVPSLNLGTTK
jgi:hypothetical protein